LFITIFHCFLLILQLFISDSSAVYNKKLLTISQSIQEKNFKLSLKLLLELERKTLFRNQQLLNTLILVSLKDRKSNTFTSSNNLLNAINYFENNSSKKSIEMLKSEISNKQSDTSIKWFEIINTRLTKHQSNLQVSSIDKRPEAKFDKNDALEILNLMKNKEKYIKYE